MDATSPEVVAAVLPVVLPCTVQLARAKDCVLDGDAPDGDAAALGGSLTAAEVPWAASSCRCCCTAVVGADYLIAVVEEAEIPWTSDPSGGEGDPLNQRNRQSASETSPRKAYYVRGLVSC